MNQANQPPAELAPVTEAPNRFRRVFVPRRFPRSYVPRSEGVSLTLVNRGIRWLLPWRMEDYPGIHKGAVSALGGRWSVATLRLYIKGSRPLSIPVALALAKAIRVRIEAGHALIAELEAYVGQHQATRKRRQREAGFMAVDPASGLSGRVKAGKRRRVESV
jgi:hypothetical protein